jgi:hypothetical protein
VPRRYSARAIVPCLDGGVTHSDARQGPSVRAITPLDAGPADVADATPPDSNDGGVSLDALRVGFSRLRVGMTQLEAMAALGLQPSDVLGGGGSGNLQVMSRLRGGVYQLVLTMDASRGGAPRLFAAYVFDVTAVPRPVAVLHFPSRQ